MASEVHGDVREDAVVDGLLDHLQFLAGRGEVSPTLASSLALGPLEIGRSAACGLDHGGLTFLLLLAFRGAELGDLLVPSAMLSQLVKTEVPGALVEMQPQTQEVGKPLRQSQNGREVVVLPLLATTLTLLFGLSSHWLALLSI